MVVPEMFYEIGVPKKLQKFQRKTPVLDSLFNYVEKKKFQQSCFPVKFAKFLRATF